MEFDLRAAFCDLRARPAACELRPASSTCELRAAPCAAASSSCELRPASCDLRDDELRDATCELRPAPCVPWVERPGYLDKAFFPSTEFFKVRCDDLLNLLSGSGSQVVSYGIPVSQVAARSSQGAARNSQLELTGRSSQVELAGRRTQLAGRARRSQNAARNYAYPNRNSICFSIFT